MRRRKNPDSWSRPRILWRWAQSAAPPVRRVAVVPVADMKADTTMMSQANGQGFDGTALARERTKKTSGRRSVPCMNSGVSSSLTRQSARMTWVTRAFTDVLVPVETTETGGTEACYMFALGVHGLETVQADGGWPWGRGTHVGRDAFEAFQTTACWEPNGKRNRYRGFACLIAKDLVKEGEKPDSENSVIRLEPPVQKKKAEIDPMTKNECLNACINDLIQ